MGDWQWGYDRELWGTGESYQVGNQRYEPNKYIPYGYLKIYDECMGGSEVLGDSFIAFEEKKGERLTLFVHFDSYDASIDFAKRVVREHDDLSSSVKRIDEFLVMVKVKDIQEHLYS